jgi:hypothetical protein
MNTGGVVQVQFNKFLILAPYARYLLRHFLAALYSVGQCPRIHGPVNELNQHYVTQAV